MTRLLAALLLVSLALQPVGWWLSYRLAAMQLEVQEHTLETLALDHQALRRLLSRRPRRRRRDVPWEEI